MGETRRRFSREFKLEAVRLITEEGRHTDPPARPWCTTALHVHRHKDPERFQRLL